MSSQTIELTVTQAVGKKNLEKTESAPCSVRTVRMSLSQWKKNKTGDDSFSEARNLHLDPTEESFIPASRS